MKEIKIGNKKYKLQYGYAVVAKGGIVKKMLELQDMFDGSSDLDMSEGIERMMATLDELLLAALQKNHADEFGYSIRTGNGHDQALEKVDELLDKYLDSEDADPMWLIGELSEELENNGFLRHMLRAVTETETEQN